MPTPKLIATLALATSVFAACSSSQIGQIQPLQDLPGDVEQLTQSTWDRFAAAFPARLGCFGEVALMLVPDVEDGDARYLPSDQVVEIEIPTSPARYPESLVHELAHRLEQACADHAQVRPAFLAAQGFDEGAPWSTGPTWGETPSEHFAEAVVEVVLGERLLHRDTVAISEAAAQLVRDWGEN